MSKFFEIGEEIQEKKEKIRRSKKKNFIISRETLMKAFPAQVKVIDAGNGA